MPAGHVLRMLGLLIFAAVIPVTPALAESITFESKVSKASWSKTLSADLRLPSGAGPHPVVVFLLPCGGMTPPVRQSQDAHRRHLLANGFGVLIFDSFTPRGIGGGRACGRDTYRAATQVMVDDAFNAMAALGRRKDVSPGNVFLLGQSLGGTAGVIAAEEGRTPHTAVFRGIAAFYPSCRDVRRSSKYRSPLIIFGAGNDDWTPVAGCKEAKDLGSMSTDPDLQVIVYPGALHAFDQPKPRYRYKGHMLGYDPGATGDARKRMVMFFKERLSK